MSGMTGQHERHGTYDYGHHDGQDFARWPEADSQSHPILQRDGITADEGRAGGGYEAVRETKAVAAHEPDAVILDIRMPPTHTDEGLRAAESLRAAHPRLGLLVLSQYVVPEYALRLLEGGERYTGYLIKDRILNHHELSDALERVVHGGTVVDPELVQTLFAMKRRDDPVDRLSAREREVLQLMAQGLSDKGVAERIFVTPNTVGTHIQRIFRKLDLPEGSAGNRRVLAVLSYLQRVGGHTVDERDRSTGNSM